MYYAGASLVYWHPLPRSPALVRNPRRNAELLGSLSASFSREARQTSDAYRQALTASTPDAWADFVEAADTLARHTESVVSVVELSANERRAREFFEQIVSENADLLAQRVPVVL